MQGCCVSPPELSSGLIPAEERCELLRNVPGQARNTAGSILGTKGSALPPGVMMASVGSSSLGAARVWVSLPTTHRLLASVGVAACAGPKSCGSAPLQCVICTLQAPLGLWCFAARCQEAGQQQAGRSEEVFSFTEGWTGNKGIFPCCWELVSS